MSSPRESPAPPYVLRTSRLVLRCLEPGDVTQRHAVVAASGAHLAELFPPIDGGPPSHDFHAAQVRKARGGFDLGQDRFYGAFERETGRMLGETCLFKRGGLGALEIGYWIRQDAAGQGVATEMACAAVKVAFELDGVSRLDLMCAPGNERSVRMAQRLGFTLEGRLRQRQFAAHNERGDRLCFSLLASEYPATRAKALPLEAFDFLGRPMP